MSPAQAERLRGLALGGLGIALFLGTWEVVGRERLLGLSWPALSDVLALLLNPARWPLYQRALSASLAALGLGYAAGLGAGLGTALLAHAARPLRPGLETLAAVIHAIPAIALAPVMILLLGREVTPAALAGLATFFIIYVSASSGLGAAAPVLHDLIRVLGGGRVARLWRVELPAALPVLGSGLRMAAPAALIGVLIGEWFGAPRGLGVLIINAMQNFQIPLLWSAVLLAVLVSLVLYGLLGLVQHALARRFR
ncbi:ABC transporter permease subunit [Roseomonas sp. GC11]|uniref:ABC transporter permease n=1 Tax=Roseomonas sp. GC11 TaxID=2950546 RepID=UPI00210E8103|nr:ABC transporter permease subunit [Roseomonas sp. GC11]MCQ4158699.1 ABC transporter permease subunit [Roseomonas sp. GC11]